VSFPYCSFSKIAVQSAVQIAVHGFAKMNDEDRYLSKRGRRWHYVRRLPVDLIHLFPSNKIQRSLKTSDPAIARLRRDAHERADEAHWKELRLEGHSTDTAKRRYDTAVLRANALGYDYLTTEELIRPGSLPELLERVEHLSVGNPTKNEIDAVLGRVDKPAVTLEDAFKVVCDEIEAEKLARKDEEGKKDWKKQRNSTIALFNELYGSPTLDQIDRSMARKFYNYWRERVTGTAATGPQITGNHANRQIGNIRKLLEQYHKHLGIDYENPFDTFSTDELADIFLRPGQLATLHKEVRLCACMMIETGARIAEILTLEPEDINTAHEIPHITIYERDGRSVKTDNSNRIIPLVGISLEAAKKVKALGGFPHYRLKRKSFSSNGNKYFRTNGLFKGKQSIYSIRHTFEDRMKEAGVSDEMRRYLMGHEIDREIYGKFGSLRLKQQAVQSIELPFDSAVLADID
jgi:integrase